MKFKYIKIDFVYFQTNGHNFSDDIRLLYDYESVRDMICTCQSYKNIHLCVDHRKRYKNIYKPPKHYNFMKKDDDNEGTVVDE